MPKVSVIMGVYNCKSRKQITKSIQSIIEQTYTDWEFIICNDGSTDATLEMLNDLQKLDKRIHVISYSTNRTLAYALNKCIEVSKGEYIARQDDDDISEIERLSKQVEFLDVHSDIAIVGSTAKIFDDIGVWGHYRVAEKP